MSKPQISLAALLYVVFSAQVVLALYLFLGIQELPIFLLAIYFLVMGGVYIFGRDRRYRQQQLLEEGGHYECPFCGHIMRTRKVFPVCPECSTDTRSRGPTLSLILALLVMIAMTALLILLEYNRPVE